MNKFLHIYTISVIFLVDRHLFVDALPTAASAVKYLRQFGYLKAPDPRSGAGLSEDKLAKGIRLFQRFTGLPQTGALDQTTLSKMEQPRCGNPDILEKDNSRRKRRYVLQGSKWAKKKITYKFDSVTDDLKPSETKKAISKAFQTWAEPSSLSFKSTVAFKQADIVIKFASGFHGDSSVFDGPGGVLAHAYFPQFGGDAHFDEDEMWVTTKGRGVKLAVVAAHEFGHSLGLGHSDNPKALMAPYYDPRISKLHEDDIQGIQALYGPPIDREFIRSGPQQGCFEKLDAVTTATNGSIYAFSGNFFWKLNDQRMEENSIQTIESVWGIRGTVDASLTHGEFTDLFQGNYVRRYINDKPVEGYPKLISEQYPGIPANIDAAWSRDDKIYFLKDAEYWVFDSSAKEANIRNPQNISTLGCTSDSIDAAVQWENMTFLFENGQYWRFRDTPAGQTLEKSDPLTIDKWLPSCLEKSATEGGGENGVGSIMKAKISLQITLLFILLAHGVTY